MKILVVFSCLNIILYSSCKRNLQNSNLIDISDEQSILDDLYNGNSNPSKPNQDKGDSVCDFYICQNGHGYCANVDGQSVCVCHPEFDTFPQDSILRCNYRKKSQLVSFLLEFFFVYGVGHFYTGNYRFAILKLLIFLFSYCFFISLKTFTKTNHNENSNNLFVGIIASVFCTGLVTWQLIDLYSFASNKFKDENNMPLAPW